MFYKIYFYVIRHICLLKLSVVTAVIYVAVCCISVTGSSSYHALLHIISYKTFVSNIIQIRYKKISYALAATAI